MKVEYPYCPDPRISLVGTFIYSGAVAVLTNIYAVLFSCLPPFTLLLARKNQWGPIFHRFRSALFLVLILSLMTPFTTPGTIIMQWGFITVSTTGLQLACLIFLKCIALLAVFACLVTPLSSSALASALYWLHCPTQLVAMFMLMDMNLHIIKKEWHNLKTAALLRGFQPKSNLHTYRTLAAMLALLLARAVFRAGRVHEGMLLRGFDGRFPSIQNGPLPKIGFIFLAITVLISSALLIINWSHPGFF